LFNKFFHVLPIQHCFAIFAVQHKHTYIDVQYITTKMH